LDSVSEDLFDGSACAPHDIGQFRLLDRIEVAKHVVRHVTLEAGRRPSDTHAHADEIRRAVELDDAEIVNNSDYRQGQTSSLQAGLRALKTSAVEGIILALVDHPAVSARVVRSLVQDFQESRAPVVIPTFQNRRGHPVLIGRVLFAELLSLSAAEGANTVIRRYGDAARLVEVADPAVLLDIDDPESYGCLAGT